jgi:hypothetical protein
MSDSSDSSEYSEQRRAGSSPPGPGHCPVRATSRRPRSGARAPPSLVIGIQAATGASTGSPGLPHHSPFTGGHFGQGSGCPRSRAGAGSRPTLPVISSPPGRAPSSLPGTLLVSRRATGRSAGDARTRFDQRRPGAKNGEGGRFRPDRRRMDTPPDPPSRGHPGRDRSPHRSGAIVPRLAPGMPVCSGQTDRAAHREATGCPGIVPPVPVNAPHRVPAFLHRKSSRHGSPAHSRFGSRISGRRRRGRG